MADNDFEDDPIPTSAVPEWHYTGAMMLLGLTPFGGTVGTLIDHTRQRLAARGERTVEDVVRATTLEVLSARLSSNPEVEAVFAQGVEAAIRTGFEAKRRLLAQVIAGAVLDDARVDQSLLFVLALRDLDAPHLRALERMRRAEDEARAAAVAAGLEPHEAKMAGNRAVQVVVQGESVVVNQALVNAGVGHQTGMTFGGPDAPGTVSEFGRELLDFLHAAVDDAELPADVVRSRPTATS